MNRKNGEKGYTAGIQYFQNMFFFFCCMLNYQTCHAKTHFNLNCQSSEIIFIQGTILQRYPIQRLEMNCLW